MAEVAKRHGISDADDLRVAQALRQARGGGREALRQLEQENAKLKKLVAERDLEIEVMKEVAAKKMVSAPCVGEQVAYVHERGRVDATGVRAAVGGAIGACATNRAVAQRDAPVIAADARARRTVSALRLSSHPGLPGAPRACR